MRVGAGYTARDMCDGQALPSPGRWPVASRRYSATPIRIRAVLSTVRNSGIVHELSPRHEKDIQDLKQDVINELERAGLELKREANDRSDVPIDFRYLDLLLKAAENQKSDWDSSRKESAWDPRSGCRASQHVTGRRESGG